MAVLKTELLSYTANNHPNHPGDKYAPGLAASNYKWICHPTASRLNALCIYRFSVGGLGDYWQLVNKFTCSYTPLIPPQRGGTRQEHSLTISGSLTIFDLIQKKYLQKGALSRTALTAPAGEQAPRQYNCIYDYIANVEVGWLCINPPLHKFFLKNKFQTPSHPPPGTAT